MFTLTQLALTGATSNAGCSASNSHAYMFSKTTKRFLRMLCKGENYQMCGFVSIVKILFEF